MSVCDVFLVLGSSLVSCPRECPFWSQNAVWKNVGVCTAAESCSVYNPILNYADSSRNVCLPCEVYGCVSCTYSDEARAFSLDSAGSDVTLPDVCLECAPGFRITEDGKACYLLHRSIWSRLFYAVVATALMASSILGLHLYLNPGKLQENLKRYRDVIASQGVHGTSFVSLRGFLKRLGHFMYVDILGVGGMIYFRFLAFLGMVSALLLVISVAHSHIPCSDMIRVFSERFRLDQPGDIAKSPTIGSWFSLSRTASLREHLLNFKYVDDALEWSVSQYAGDYAATMRLLYTCVMALTIGFMVSQRNFMRKYFKEHSRVQNFTLILTRVPPLHSLEEFVENATSVKPMSVAVAYDLRNVEEPMKEFLDVHEENSSVYVNLEKSAEQERILTNLHPSGMAFAVFSTIKELELARHSLRTTGICEADYCEVEPEDVMWTNIGRKGSITWKIVGITALAVAIQIIWTCMFFMPYAAYRLHSDSSDIFEIIWLTIFVSAGSSMVAQIIRRVAGCIEFISRESLESYLMCVKFVTDIVNMGLNVLVAHFVNYGGRFKVLSVVKDFSMYMRTPTFKVGEEVSISLSLNAYMVNVLLLMPLFFFLFMYYGAPLITALLVLTADLNERQVAQFLRHPRFDFTSRYCDALVHFTCSLLLQFVIRSKLNAIAISASLLLGYLMYYAMDSHIVQHKAERVKINGYAAFYNALMLWSIPTGILAACPAYWRWRGQEGRPCTPFVIFFLHVGLYCIFQHLLYNCRRRFGRTEVNTSEVNYTSSNPVYKLRRMTAPA